MTYGDSTLRKTLQGQGRVLLFNYWLTYCVLKAKKPRFQPLLPLTAPATTSAPASEASIEASELTGVDGKAAGTEGTVSGSQLTGGGNGA